MSTCQHGMRHDEETEDSRPGRRAWYVCEQCEEAEAVAEDVQQAFDPPGTLHTVEINLVCNADPDVVAKRIMAALGQMGPGAA